MILPLLSQFFANPHYLRQVQTPEPVLLPSDYSARCPVAVPGGAPDSSRVTLPPSRLIAVGAKIYSNLWDNSVGFFADNAIFRLVGVSRGVRLLKTLCPRYEGKGPF